MYKSLVILSMLFVCSCEQMLRSVAEGAAESSHNRDSLAFEYNEKPISSEKQDVVERKKSGEDSLYLIRSYFVDGKVYYNAWYRNDKPDGITTFYSSKGKVQYTMEYKNGRMYTLVNSFDLKGNKNDGGTLKNGSGTVKIYHPITGNLIYSSIYKDGLKNGPYMTFYSDGRKFAEMGFKNDTNIGEYVEYYHTGRIKENGNVDMFTATGNSEKYYLNGKLLSHDNWKNGVQIAYREYDENNFLVKEKATLNGKLIGINYFYNSEGILLSKGQMFNDKKHGDYEYYYSSGKLKTKETYSNDTLMTETIWYENGKLSVENFFKDGLKSGVCKDYYPTGNLKAEQTYLKGVEEGMYRSYFNNGKLYNDGMFKDGELTGDLKFYSDKGVLTRTKKYN